MVRRQQGNILTIFPEDLTAPPGGDPSIPPSLLHWSPPLGAGGGGTVRALRQ